MSAPADGPGWREAPPDIRARQPKAIHSALTVLEEVARFGPGITARQVSENLAIPRATAYRLLNLLVQEEYLVRLPDLSGFALSRKVAALAAAAEPDATVPRAAHEVVSRMRSRFRGGVTLALFRGGSIRLADTDPDFPLSDPRRMVDDPGASALGRLLLAERHDRDARAEIARRGYTSQIGSFLPERGCIALPVRDADGALVAGLALSATIDQLATPAPIIALLTEGAADLEPLLA